MKKSFTLIELMVALASSLILINFVFSYQLNFLNEMQYVEAREKLAMHSFKVTELVAKGFKSKDSNTRGLICLSEYKNTAEIRTYTDIDGITKKMEIIYFANPHVTRKIDDYLYPGLNSMQLLIRQVQDINNNKGDKKPWIYLIENQTNAETSSSDISNPFYLNYTRLVYTK